MAAFVAFVTGVGFFLTGLALRPSDARIVWGNTWGFLENSRPLGRAIGILGILLAILGLTRMVLPVF